MYVVSVCMYVVSAHVMSAQCVATASMPRSEMRCPAQPSRSSRSRGQLRASSCSAASESREHQPRSARHSEDPAARASPQRCSSRRSTLYLTKNITYIHTYIYTLPCIIRTYIQTDRQTDTAYRTYIDAYINLYGTYIHTYIQYIHTYNTYIHTVHIHKIRSYSSHTK